MIKKDTVRHIGERAIDTGYLKIHMIVFINEGNYDFASILLAKPSNHHLRQSYLSLRGTNFHEPHFSFLL
jgi:hypothetical protein